MADISDKDVERLRSIKSFPSLIKYLRDELGWDIASDEIDDLFFGYSAEELGIDPKTAPVIKEIKRLRPLSPKQPWGIFFIKFEKKALPIVALRKILASVAIKKRASSRKSDQASWDSDDLLFVSNYGEGEDRQISFAHFSQDPDRRRPPVLKVLGWDTQNTNLRYKETIKSLREKLSWREEYTKNIELWRDNWRSAFRLQHRQTINDSKKLASQLAELARSIRGEINGVLAIETEKGPLRQIMESFRESLIHDIDEDQFADMYAQTISYGLLSSRMVDPEAKGADDFASHMRTNPFLRELMETFIEVGGRKKKGKVTIDFDDLGVNDVIEMLDDVDMKAVLLDFDDRNPQEDPVIHFFEGFLQEYDKSIRKDRGVFYTPRPVVSFIVRSVDELLRTEFGLEDGLADTTTWGEMAGRIDDLEIPEGATPDKVFVQILDPATGTGTFLVEVIDLIHKTMIAKWQSEGHGKKKIEDRWNDYVPKHLLPRLHGYELMMAPYAIAQMKIGLKLHETGYRFESDERARVYLTNALEPAQDFSGTLAFAIPALAHEAEAVNAIKRDQRFTAVIGNPPYSGHSANKGEWISQLIGDYYRVDGKPLGEKNPKWLQDDYVKFIALGQNKIQQTGYGVQSYITNHGYIDNPTFRGMRQQLAYNNNSITVLDLHGNSTKRERSPDGSADGNVFAIKQGVAVFAAVRLKYQRYPIASIEHGHLFGEREHKHTFLSQNTLKSATTAPALPATPFYLFFPQDLDLRREYDAYDSMTSVMPVNVLGFQTHRDHFAVDFDKEILRERLVQFRDTKLANKQVADTYNLQDNRDWNVEDARRTLQADSDWEKWLISCSYRPFDLRPCYFSKVAMDYPRKEMLDHVANRANLCLGLGRQGSAVQGPVWHLISVSKVPIDANIFRRGGINVFPLWLYPETGELSLSNEPRLNFNPDFLKALAADLKLPQEGAYGMPSHLSPEEIFHYIYAVFHSLDYRARYAEFLKTDFPRLPRPRHFEMIWELARLGNELVAIHLMEAPYLKDLIGGLEGKGNFQVERVSYSDETVWIDKAKTRGFKGVPEEVWNFHVGGYQVCEKWLKDRQAKGGNNARPGRVLTDEDIEHYQKIVVALSETIRIMAEIDEVIEAHGGWPGAFQTGSTAGMSEEHAAGDQQASLL